MPKQNEDDLFEFKIHEMSREEIHEAIHRRIHKINNEFTNAFEFIKKYPQSVTFFGSARFNENDLYYKKARALASKISKQLGYTIFSGGGGGIMEAGNRGASEVDGTSVGLNIRLPREQQRNKYTSKTIEVSYFFVRKVALAFAAEAYVFFPGGFGTLDEFFEILTLIQTKKIPRVPIILFGNEYWSKMSDFFEKTLYENYKTIDLEDMSLYLITENEDLIIDVIRRAPTREPMPTNHRFDVSKL